MVRVEEKEGEEMEDALGNDEEDNALNNIIPILVWNGRMRLCGKSKLHNLLLSRLRGRSYLSNPILLQNAP